MPSEDNKILKYNHREKSLKALFIIYADLECQLEKMHPSQNNLEKSYAEKKNQAFAFWLLIVFKLFC